MMPGNRHEVCPQLPYWLRYPYVTSGGIIISFAATFYAHNVMLLWSSRITLAVSI